MRQFVLILTICGLSTLAWYSLLLARADASFRDGTLPALETAVRLVPGAAQYHEALAEALEWAGKDPDSELEAATRVSPRESRYWIRRSFRAEIEQKYADAERFLIEANRVDKGFDPRWALMNYYFRRGDSARFWTWTRSALEMSYEDMSPIFRLCLAMSDDIATTRRALPSRVDALAQFYAYLAKNQYFDHISPVAEELAPVARPEDVPMMIEYCDRQKGRDSSSALLVWNQLCSRKLIPFDALAPDRGAIVTNGDFAASPLQQGFDWRYGGDPSETTEPLSQGRGLSIKINGKEPDRFELISQSIPLTPGRQYFVDYEYRLADASPDSGLQWVVRSGSDAGAAAEPLTASPVLNSSDWTHGRVVFSTGGRSSAVLALEYRRALGTIRWTGEVQIRSVSAGLSPSPERAK